jgi:outer membrane protein assembly factor BamE (lipoprotein component of BamABCDE complex)
MRNLIVLLGILTLAQSCTIALPSIANEAARENGNAYTHSEFMNNLTTKRQVIQKFGSPTTRESIEGIELWYYNKGTSTYAYSSGTSNTNLNSNYNNGINARTNASAGTSVSSYEKYVEFQFDGDRVVNWRTKGVNYGKVAPSYEANMILGMIIDGGLGIYGMCWAVRNDPYMACW